MRVVLGWGTGERERKESDGRSWLRPAQRWAVDQRSWSPLERQAKNVGDEETNSSRIESDRGKER